MKIKDSVLFFVAIFFVVFSVLVFVIVVIAEPEKAEKVTLYYTYNESKGTATVVNPEQEFPYCHRPYHDMKSAEIPATVQKDMRTYIVTGIGDAFRFCSLLEYVTIPNSVVQISDIAFNDCERLQSINVATDNPVFCSVDGVMFNKDTTKLIRCPLSKKGNYTIPNTVTIIGSNAFYGCRELATIYIPNNVVSIEEDAFCSCENLTAINIPDGITTIEWSTFKDCHNLVSVKLPNSVTKIEGGAFEFCSSLVSVNIPDGVSRIEPYTFLHCINLDSITIPAKITNIGYNAFESCDHMTAFIVEKDNLVYSSIDGVLYNKEKTKLIRCPSGKNGVLNIPAGVVDIEDGAFENCYNLIAITFPKSIKNIGNGDFINCMKLESINIPDGVAERVCFAGCRKLKSITIPEGVTSFSEHDQDGCDSLTYLTIPKSVTNIYSNNLINWNSMKCVYCKPVVPPSFDRIRDNFHVDTLYVPMESVEAYKNSKWGELDIANIVGYKFQ